MYMYYIYIIYTYIYISLSISIYPSIYPCIYNIVLSLHIYYNYSYIHVAAILLFKLIIAQTVTIIFSSKSIWIRGTIFCSIQNLLILSITLCTWILTFLNWRDVSTSFPDNWFFLLVKCGILRVAPTGANSSLKVNYLSAKIQSLIEIFLKKLESILICWHSSIPTCI